MTYKKSLGNVSTKYYKMKEDLQLDTGNILETPTIAYETYGKLNNEKSNVILVCHALTGDAHAAGWHDGDKKPGWWNIIIGPGKPLDTNRYFIIKLVLYKYFLTIRNNASRYPDTLNNTMLMSVYMTTHIYSNR